MLIPHRSILNVLACFCSAYCAGQVPLISFPDLTSITFHEQTTLIYQHTYGLNDAAITTRLTGQLNSGNRDFEGWPNNEFYDVFYSNADGTFNINGGYVSVECRFDIASGGGGLNINEVEFHFGSGNSIYGSYVTSYVSNGSNYVPGSQELAADCNLVTLSGMGNTQNTNIRLRVTIGMLNAASTIIEEACSESGFEVIVGNSTFDESNPSGTEVLVANNGCDSLVYVDITFNEIYSQEINYMGCSGDGFSISVGNTTYNEANPSGTEVLMTQDNCDSTILIDLVFYPIYYNEINYQGCEGDGYSVIVNGITYNESNPIGTETLTTFNGCDSLITIDLVFNPASMGNESYSGCSGDGYTIVINSEVYNEKNPQGIEIVPNVNGCDSTVIIDLEFASASYTELFYTGCSGDNYELIVNGTTYDESNPEGEEILINENGCDSTVIIDLEFASTSFTEFFYTGCSGDNYELTVNGIIYDESNPDGVEILINENGCDSIVYIELTFNTTLITDELHTSCSGSGFEIVINGNTYDEGNPFGTESMTSVDGCDSIINILLTFIEATSQVISHTGCMGDGYSIIVNGTFYNEVNPTGQEIMTGANGCDSIVDIQLIFTNSLMGFESYSGCSGDGYSVMVNGTVYDELNPSGVEVLTAQGGCDSTVTVNLIFLNIISVLHDYIGCSDDGYSFVINGNVYDESNPNGLEIIQGSTGCDTSVTIELTFQPISNQSISYVGCEGDGYEVQVNGTTYNELNPQGNEILTALNGCDSIITISLNYPAATQHAIQYTGCAGDNYFVLVNGTLYNEINPTGIETLTGSNGCDSVVTVNLVFGNEYVSEENYTGCSGDGYSIIVNGNIYNEQYPTGIEFISGTSGCDTLVNIDLTFAQASYSTITYEGCSGDHYNISINGIVYDESHPGGTEYLVSHAGCDSIVEIALAFAAIYDTLLSYQGCIGDGYATIVNGTTYDELHPSGVETMVTVNGCDSMVTIAMSFANIDSTAFSYTGCIGDGYSLTINGSVYNESNPLGFENVQTTDGCDSVIQVALIFEDCEEKELDCTPYIPNVISPNYDGINDEFGFSYDESCEIERFRVALFDRWGEELYNSEDPLFKWFGDFRGKQLQPGVFVYVAEFYFKGSAHPLIKQGDLTLIR